MTDIVTFETLKEASGYNDPASVRAWMERNGIKSIVGKHGRPCTTIKMFNEAMGDKPDDDQQQVISA